MRSALKRIIDPMLAAGILKRSSSPTVSRALILPKSGKPGEWRMVVDFRELNSQVARNAYAIPRISQCLATLARGRVFIKARLCSVVPPDTAKQEEQRADGVHDGTREL